MDPAVLYVLTTVVTWLSLLVVVPAAQNLAGFSLPPWPETLWKLAVVAFVGNSLSAILSPLHPLLGLAAAAIAFLVFMVKWFDVDAFGAEVLVVLVLLLGRLLGLLVAIATR